MENPKQYAVRINSAGKSALVHVVSGLDTDTVTVRIKEAIEGAQDLFEERRRHQHESVTKNNDTYAERHAAWEEAQVLVKSAKEHRDALSDWTRQMREHEKVNESLPEEERTLFEVPYPESEHDWEDPEIRARFAVGAASEPCIYPVPDLGEPWDPTIENIFKLFDAGDWENMIQGTLLAVEELDFVVIDVD